MLIDAKTKSILLTKLKFTPVYLNREWQSKRLCISFSLSSQIRTELKLFSISQIRAWF